jgi:hypothetical protein
MNDAERSYLALLTVFAVAWAAGSPAARAETGALPALKLPDAVAGLVAVPDEDATYARQSIYDYLDGGAEVYLAYGMVSCRSRRYKGPGGAVILDLFDMGSADGAYGAFTHDQDGEEVQVGQAALLRAGWLSAWHGPFFLSLSAEGDAEALRSAMLALGRTVAAALGPPAAVPALVLALPARGRVARSVRYLRDPLPLRAHLDLGGGNPLRLGPRTFAALARYRRGGETAALLVADYVDAAVAAEVERDVRAVMAGRDAVIRRAGTRLAFAASDARDGLAVMLADEALGVRMPPDSAGKGRRR